MRAHRAIEYFRQEAGRIYDDCQLRLQQALTNVLAWAMVMNGDPRSFRLFNEIISLPEDAATHAGFLHFFALSLQTVHYGIVRQFVGNGCSDPAAAERLCRRLEQCVYDFHEEVEYLKLCMWSFAKRGSSRGGLTNPGALLTRDRTVGAQPRAQAMLFHAAKEGRFPV